MDKLPYLGHTSFPVCNAVKQDLGRNYIHGAITTELEITIWNKQCQCMVTTAEQILSHLMKSCYHHF